jgi:hypothetical protein
MNPFISPRSRFSVRLHLSAREPSRLAVIAALLAISLTTGCESKEEVARRDFGRFRDRGGATLAKVAPRMETMLAPSAPTDLEERPFEAMGSRVDACQEIAKDLRDFQIDFKDLTDRNARGYAYILTKDAAYIGTSLAQCQGSFACASECKSSVYILGREMNKASAIAASYGIDLPRVKGAD